MKLADLKASFDAHKILEDKFNQAIGGDDWTVHFYFYSDVPEYSLWRKEHAHIGRAKIVNGEVVELGRYASEDIEPLLKKIKELS